MKKSSDLDDEGIVALGKIAECALGLLLLILPLIFLVQLAYALVFWSDKDIEWLSSGLYVMGLGNKGGFLIFLGMLVIAAVLLLKDSLGHFIAFVIYAIADDDK